MVREVILQLTTKYGNTAWICPRHVNSIYRIDDDTYSVSTGYGENDVIKIDKATFDLMIPYFEKHIVN
jgi:hypothetical protein